MSLSVVNAVKVALERYARNGESYGSYSVYEELPFRNGVIAAVRGHRDKIAVRLERSYIFVGNFFRSDKGKFAAFFVSCRDINLIYGEGHFFTVVIARYRTSDSIPGEQALHRRFIAGCAVNGGNVRIIHIIRFFGNRIYRQGLFLHLHRAAARNAVKVIVARQARIHGVSACINVYRLAGSRALRVIGGKAACGDRRQAAGNIRSSKANTYILIYIRRNGVAVGQGKSAVKRPCALYPVRTYDNAVDSAACKVIVSIGNARRKGICTCVEQAVILISHGYGISHRSGYGRAEQGFLRKRIYLVAADSARSYGIVAVSARKRSCNA